MDLISLILQNLLSPALLFFALGILAGVVRSDLEIPQSISRYLSIFLMMAIGLKGGVAFANTPEFTAEVLWTVLAGLVLGFLQPVLGFVLLRLTTRIDRPTAAAVAAHYGSISIVTFATAVSFLGVNSVIYAGYIVAVVALMEAPAILSGLYLARRNPGQKALATGAVGAAVTPDVALNADLMPASKPAFSGKLLHEVLTNGAIFLLVGTFLIGWIIGQPGLDKLEGFVVTPFQGVLCLFLLDMGLVVARNLGQLRQFTLSLVAFGLYMPLIGAAVGLAMARLIGLDVGTGTLFAVLCASASYIAVPAAMRMALPEAKAAIYLPMSLAITFPFNIVAGIPLYYAGAKALLG